MNQTKYQIGDQVIVKSSSETPGQAMIIDKIRSNAKGENEYQLTHLSKNDPLINHEWFNEDKLMLSGVTLE